jgi:hypothetical protein
MDSKRSSLYGRKTLWKEYMVRDLLGSTGGRTKSKVPNDRVTMSTNGFKSKEDDHLVRGSFSSVVESMGHVAT